MNTQPISTADLSQAQRQEVNRHLDIAERIQVGNRALDRAVTMLNEHGFTEMAAEATGSRHGENGNAFVELVGLIVCRDRAEYEDSPQAAVGLALDIRKLFDVVPRRS